MLHIKCFLHISCFCFIVLSSNIGSLLYSSYVYIVEKCYCDDSSIQLRSESRVVFFSVPVLQIAFVTLATGSTTRANEANEADFTAVQRCEDVSVSLSDLTL